MEDKLLDVNDETATFHDDTLERGVVIGIQQKKTSGGFALGSAFDTISVPTTTGHTTVTASHNYVLPYDGRTLR